MKSLFQQAPPERLIQDTGDGLKSLRALRDRYIMTDNPSAAARVATLIRDVAVDQSENINADPA